MALYNTLTKAEFEEKVLESDKLVLVDFWAEWCPPCVAMAPALHDIGEKMDGVDVVKVNIEESPENGQLAGAHGVRSIPNMLIFKDGKIVDQLIGMMPQAALEDNLKAHI